MRKGKIAAQCAHASMKVLLDLMGHVTAPRGRGDLYIRSLWIDYGSALDKWIIGCFAKICVYVESEEDLLALEAQAKEADIPHAMIVDSGRTEFHGVPTKTVLAIGPAWVDEIDKITGHLPLL